MNYTATYVFDGDDFAERISLGDPTHTAADLGNVAIFPGMVNAHSHAFQRAIRGRTEVGTSDNFWSWRDAMYRAALTLDADDFEIVTRFAFLEMALAGVTTVGEFHYVHHQPDGTPYDDPNELAHRVIRAAKDVGLRITLLNVAYQWAGFSKPPLDAQRRFVTEPETFLENVAALQTAYRDDAMVTIGVAPHSIRAVDGPTLQTIYGAIGDAPIHIHVAEQTGEVEASIEAYGERPVAWLAREGFLRSNTTLVHATHVEPSEIDAVANAGSTVCVCPTTERNLGDGIFQTRAFWERGVPLCLGTDSHIQIDMFEEARALEYLERLTRRERNVVTDRPARALMQTLGTFGANALGVETEGDFITIDLESPRFAGVDAETMADYMVFSASPSDVRDVFVGHRCIVSDREHPRGEKISHDFRKVMETLWQ